MYLYTDIRETGKRVSQLMELNKTSKKEICSLLNISYSQLNRLLLDECEWSADKVLILSDFFKMPYEKLYFGITAEKMTENKQLDIYESIHNLFADINSLPGDKRREVLEYLFKEMMGVIYQDDKN